MGLCTPNNTMFVDGNSIDEVDPFASEEWSCEEQHYILMYTDGGRWCQERLRKYVAYGVYNGYIRIE